MAGTFIKICGVTRAQDALAAARLGADAIGIILHADSPRRVTPERASEIVSVLPKTVRAIGVFVDAPAPSVLATCQRVGIGHAQLHGSETVDELGEMVGLKLWRAIRVTGMFQHHLQELKAQMLLRPTVQIEALVLDTSDPSVAGGTGKPNDWEAVRIAQDHGRLDRLPPIVAAGGLTPQTVGDVVRLIRPWGVDVSSGVEEAKGIKSHQKMEAFIRAVRAADEHTPHL
jgi:phosphoribosylanthranilate isomerase